MKSFVILPAIYLVMVALLSSGGIGVSEERAIEESPKIDRPGRFPQFVTVYLGAGVGKLDWREPEVMTVLLLDGDATKEDLVARVMKMLKDESIIQVGSVETMPPFSLVLSAGQKDFKSIALVERDGTVKLQPGFAEKVPNLSEIQVGVNEIGIANAARYRKEAASSGSTSK